MSKFTKGPWRVSENASITRVVTKDLFGITHWTYPNGEEKANARLIAAAPEMFEIIDSLFEIIGLHVPDAMARKIVEIVKRVDCETSGWNR